MAKRKTIGVSPLDLVIPEAETPQRKERLTVHLTPNTIDRVKNCVYWTPGETLAGLTETALKRIVDEIETERGEPFPNRKHPLKGGRPLK